MNNLLWRWTKEENKAILKMDWWGTNENKDELVEDLNVMINMDVSKTDLITSVIDWVI